MLDQEKTGKYIAEKRKQLGMTQKELAEKIGLTDKAVSKWERGKSIPDSSLFEELCKIFQISLNEFLSGEDLEKECYPDKAEENMKVLIKEKHIQKKSSRIVIVGLITGFLLIMLGLYAALLNAEGFGAIARFIDFPSFLFLLGIVLVILALSGTLLDFFKMFAICFQKKEVDREQIQRSYKVTKWVLVLNLLAGTFVSVGQTILTLSAIEDLVEGFHMLSVLAIALWYSIFLDLLLLPFLFRLQKFKE
ncbi:MAG: helix-turn-helix domain-containing protein [Lachnospiraceae bacterium]|nr:helix-turn-helix domain-containing protein [Lachnospiraceae bacterium]